jgi:hypothetical protein
MTGPLNAQLGFLPQEHGAGLAAEAAASPTGGRGRVEPIL